MRVLALSPFVPSDRRSGGHGRILHLYRRLAELGHDVTLCAPVPPGQEADAQAAAAHGIAVRGTTRGGSRAAEVLAAVGRRPWLALRPAAVPLTSWQLEVLYDAIRPAVRAALADRPDVVVVENDLAAAWRRHLPRDLPAVVALHDTSWTYLARRAAVADGPAAALLAVQARMQRRFDRRWLPRFDEVVCVSDVDAARVGALLGRRPPPVVGNGVDLRSMTPRPEPDGPPTVLFPATMNYPPNADAARWLLEAIWPLVRAQRPDARLALVGRDPDAVLLAHDGVDGVTVPGGVPDIRPAFHAAHVVAAPIRSGGGTRLKILDAGAAGRAVVSTTVGAEGLAVVDGEHVLIADDAAAFAAATVRLLGDAALRARLAAANRALVEARYGWDALGDRFAAILTDVAGQPVGGSSARTTDQ